MSPPRRSEAYEDPLRKRSAGLVSSKASVQKERFVTVQEDGIEWSNLIFLPFHPVFRMFVVFVVFVKAMLGPIQSVYPIVYCNDVMDYHPALIFIKYCYWYCCDSFYGIDTFLHIVHRQVVDKAMRREHLPKSAVFLTLDLVSLIPFYRLVSTDSCPPARVWPNILAFNEFLVIYRITEYFSLASTHSYSKLLLGYAIVMIMCINCIGCFWLLVTHQGFCELCNNDDVYYDWRAFIWHKLNETDEGYATFVYGAVFVYSFAINAYFDKMMPSAILEFIMVCMFMVAGYTLGNFIIIPKAFAESMLRFRRICDKYPNVKKIVEETKRRNPNDDSYKQVEDYYHMLWIKRKCIATVPPFFLGLPSYLRLDVKQDLLWPLFYHSPTLRKTTFPFRRWITEVTVIGYKLPTEKFFSSQRSTNGTLYYLKSGIVQLISIDDGATPILSLTSGTIFGDVSFYVPHIRRKVLTRCLTYCEFYYVERKSFIKGLHKYPIDRKIVLEDVIDRLNHAKLLFNNKKLVRGLDRNEDEGICWLKRRWWELSNMIESYTQKTGEPKEVLKGHLPRDETLYHCSKYIGQLVLCKKTELQTKSMFTNFKFPWILNTHSQFGLIWYRIVSTTVFTVLVMHPQYLVKPEIPAWFVFYTFWTDTIYVIDIGVSLVTAVKKYDSVTKTFATVMFERFKSVTFMLDMLSTIWIEDIADLCGAPQYYYSLQFNRLIKVYVLFYGQYLKHDIKKDPIVNVCRKIGLVHFTLLFICSHLVFEMLFYFPDLTMIYFYGETLCSKLRVEPCMKIDPLAGVAISWAFEWTYSENSPKTMLDIYVNIGLAFLAFISFVYCKGRFISYLYLVNKEITKYQSFVLHLKSYYQHYRIHQDLLKRLDRYLICHWKYYQGTDVMEPNTLENEAREIYWKAQGNVVKAIITECAAFKSADPLLILDLTRIAKFLILPKNSNILMFGIQCKNVTWVAQGHVKCEYADAKGEMLTEFHGPGSLLSICEVFLGKVSLRSYTSYTECELVYIPIKEFFDVYKTYKYEYEYVQTCIKEYGSMYNEIFKKHVLKHRDYQSKLRDRIYSTRMSMVSNSKMIADIQETRSLPVEGFFWGEPESGFMQSWMLFRVVIVCISITSASMLGGVGAVSRWIFMMISAFCDCVAFIDIIVKLCLPYYNSRGLYITDKRKCWENYVTKGFLLDIIGAAPWFSVIKALLSQEISDDNTFLINTVCKFAHLYIVFAYFDYITDTPTVNLTYIMIIKWQIVNILIVMGASHYLMVNCVYFQFDSLMDLIDVRIRETCWMPTLFNLPNKLDGDQLHLIFAQSLNLAESGMMRMNFGRFVIHRGHLGVGFILFTLGLIFWFISCYTLTLLVLNGRGDTVFQHSVYQLERFLKSERVEVHVITRVMEHFRYCWIRTKGINIQQLTNDRIGVVFRQDLSYYFYKKTFTILDSIIGGGEAIQRQLASVSDVAYFLPQHDIFREMDIVPNVCIVHRGRVNIYKNGRKIIILTKGDIFGQLEGVRLRPIRVTATADDHVDLLYIDVAAFQSIISPDIKRNIRRNKQAKNYFMATKNIFIENPYDTVQYLLRGRKTISLPRTRVPAEARKGSWYTRWLYLAWLIGPFISSVIVLVFIMLPPNSTLWLRLYCTIFFTDAIDLTNFIAEFFTVELLVVNNKCTPCRLGVKKLKDWGLYVDAISLLLPLATLITGDWMYQLARLLRLKFLIDFEFHFCRGFRSQKAPYVLKFTIMVLLLHLFTCGWILFGCKEPKFPIKIADTSHLNRTIDFTQWISPDERGAGCARATRLLIDDQGRENPSFVVPRYWPHDYVVAMTYIILIHTHTSLDTVIAVSLKQIYYKVFVTFFMYLLDMWIMAVAINFAFTRYRVLYTYDYNVQTMMSYLTDNGICQSLAEIVRHYTDQVWKRQKGDWLPELAYQGPPCLRQDLFTSLYMHHLEAPPTYRQLPDYFKRQLSARFSRVVIFPGKCIVKEGDTFNTTYFIHEGEVEKWYTAASGEGQLMSVLYTNGYFGCIAGLFRNAGFQFSYYTRTVVDMVYLNLSNWEDLLESYPDVKAMIYNVTRQMRKDHIRNAFGKPMTLHPHEG